MLFNSLNFALFVPVVFALYWFVTQKNLTLQNLLLLVASYFFYACWDYRFLFLLIFSTLLDFFTGSKIFAAKTTAGKKFWLWLSVGINLGFLGVFKYYNFFAGSFSDLLSHFGMRAGFNTINVILPVGISFYTFHGLSYVFDIYRGRITPVKSFIEYSVFVSFFPLLVAGPIERATHLLPQIQQKRRFNYSQAVNGLKQILWGLFKKIAIADNCAEFANMIFNHHEQYPGSVLVMGALFFTIQIYCDFSGYSDIALGTARLFGMELLRNFAYPYFSRDIAEFWRRWHISLSSWFKDYLYIPLGGSKGGLWQRIRNTFIIFLVSGFWHGANWTFLAWGFLNAVYFLPLLLTNRNRSNMEIVAKGRLLPSLSEFLKMLLTFSLTVFAWIFFRAESIGQAFSYIGKIFSRSILTVPSGEAFEGASFHVVAIIILSIMFMLMEWLGREEQFAIAGTGMRWPKPARWAFYISIAVLTFYFTGVQQQFVYFQF
ncbi:MBOAT family protein [Mucilaginibacter pallidiroseus]|uniref:MBOAT family protein n=1 Tax=Mucilaginibacter pallidiroseus TaxID=2599295 RepID=A0A563UGE6_9SPHI|nr:MBOAT family O-acyltransferase [Mucilaginibacter pallidiroseus]TWR30452.1 MBOAT family protein [Mucilaginibacter pallidiroseus]